MKFLKTFVMTLVLCYLFGFLGGWMLFDFHRNYYAAVTACALLLTVVISAFSAQAEKMEQLEKRVKELEEKESGL